MGKKFKSFMCVFIILYLLVPLTVHAKNEDVSIKASIGFEGYFKMGEWVPINIEVQNKGEDIKGSIEISANQDEASAILYTTPAIVPKGATKQFTMYIKTNILQRRFNVNLMQGGELVQSFRIDDAKPISNNNYLMGILTEDKNAMSYWWQGLGGNNSLFSNYQAVALSLGDIPDKNQVMDNFHIIILNDMDTSELSDGQLDTLKSWVDRGGILIIGTGARGEKTLKGIKEFLPPFEILGSKLVSGLSEFENISNTKFDSAASVEIMQIRGLSDNTILNQGEDEIVYRVKSGEGDIFISSFDLGLKPMTDWQGSKAFWNGLFIKHLDTVKQEQLQMPNIRNNYKYDLIRGIKVALGGIEAMDLPSIGKISIILVIYLLIVGPIHYLVLKKLDKREWAWGSIPVLVLIFSLIIYQMAYNTKGNELIINNVSLIDMKSGDVSIADRYIGVFIPKRGRYEVTLDKNVLLSTDIGDTDPRDNEIKRENVVARVMEGNPSGVEILNANVWTMQTINVKETSNKLGGMVAELYYQDGRINGTITNNTPFPLEDGVLISYYGYEKLGNIAAGETKDVDMSIMSNVQGDMIYNMVNTLYPDQSNQNFKTFRALSDDERKYFIKRRMLEGILRKDSSMKHEGGHMSKALYFIGFSDQKVWDDPMVNGKASDESYYFNAITSGIEFKKEHDDNVGIPPGVLNGILDTKASQGLHAEGKTIYIPSNTEARIAFDMRDFKDVDISKFDIYLRTFSGQGNVKIYNNEKNEFEVLDKGTLGQDMLNVINLNAKTIQKFVDDDYNIRISISSSSMEDLIIEMPTFALEGRQS